MAIAALWVLPIALLIVGFSKKAQNHFTRRQNAALIAVADGVQECLETIIVLSDGTVAEMEPPEELMKKNGAFTQMVNLQTESQNWAL